MDKTIWKEPMGFWRREERREGRRARWPAREGEEGIGG